MKRRFVQPLSSIPNHCLPVIVPCGMLAVVKLCPAKISPATPKAIPNKPMIATGPLTNDHPV